MKVGDLVQLSGYGANRVFNSKLTMVDAKQTGLITGIKGNYHSYPFIVQWSKTRLSGGLYWCHDRRELKHATKRN